MSSTESSKGTHEYSVHHHLPETPSASLNSWLKSHYSVSSNTVQYAIGLHVCAFYKVATALHHAILRARADFDPKIVWMASCGLISVAVAFAAWLIFTLMMAMSFVIYGILHYAAIITAVVGMGLGAAGALHFGKDVQPDKRGECAVGVGGGGEYHYRSTTTTSSYEYGSRSHDD